MLEIDTIGLQKAAAELNTTGHTWQSATLVDEERRPWRQLLTAAIAFVPDQ